MPRTLFGWLIIVPEFDATETSTLVQKKKSTITFKSRDLQPFTTSPRFVKGFWPPTPQTFC